MFQCSHIAAKAFGCLSLLMKGFLTSDVSILILAYKIYVRPILEYNSPVWNPWLISDIKECSVTSLVPFVSELGFLIFVILYDCKILIFGHGNTEGCIVTLCSATRLCISW